MITSEWQRAARRGAAPHTGLWEKPIAPGCNGAAATAPGASTARRTAPRQIARAAVRDAHPLVKGRSSPTFAIRRLMQGDGSRESRQGRAWAAVVASFDARARVRICTDSLSLRA